MGEPGSRPAAGAIPAMGWSLVCIHISSSRLLVREFPLVCTSWDWLSQGLGPACAAGMGELLNLQWAFGTKQGKSRPRAKLQPCISCGQPDPPEQAGLWQADQRI